MLYYYLLDFFFFGKFLIKFFNIISCNFGFKLIFEEEIGGSFVFLYKLLLLLFKTLTLFSSPEIIFQSSSEINFTICTFFL